MADEHTQVPPQQSPAGVPPGEPATARPPAPGTNGELVRPASATAPPASAGRPSPARAILELVWPSTGAHVAQTDSVREVVETVVFVVVLVLLLKSFAAEAFVIPTGSMAETLWGYQKVVTCPQCGYQFPVNCSSEVDPQAARHSRVDSCVCPNCRQQIRLINPDPPPDGEGRQPLSPKPGDEVVETLDPRYDSGDRVLVAKSLYEFGLMHPERRDVVVFKYPGDSSPRALEPFPRSGPQHDHVPMNYIKRLIGLGGETIGIFYGKLYVAHVDEQDANDRAANPKDLWRREYMHDDKFREELEHIDQAGPGNSRFQILRKRPDKILALRRLVYNNDHPAADMAKLPRWKAADGGWNANDGSKEFQTVPGQGGDWSWVRYSHLLRPSAGDAGTPKPQLITDFMGYNSYHAGLEQNWVGDLILECEVAVNQPSGEFVLELSKGVDRFRAHFDLATSKCTLSRLHDGKEEELANQAAALKPGTHQLRFANVDERLTVWVDGALPFGDGVAYDPAPQRGPTAANDLQPASFGAKGAAVSVRAIKLWRDTYYTLDPGRSDSHITAGTPLSGDDWADPSRWDVLKHLQAKTFYIQPDHYLCLGDNSPESSDGRSWGTVPKRLMLGRALLVYYPFYLPGWSPVNRVGPIR
jgi:signal peptidase I